MEIIEIIEVGYPHSLVQRKDSEVSELIQTTSLVEELWNSLYDYKEMYKDAYNHACAYQERADDAENEVRSLLRDMRRGAL